MKLLKVGLLILTCSLLVPLNASALDGFYGHQLRFTVDYPVLGETIANILEATVNNKIEFQASGGTLFTSAVPVLVDVSAYDIDFSYDAVSYPSHYATTDFNGYVFTDINNTINPIIGLSFDTTMAIESERIWFNENQIFMNMSSLAFDSADTIHLNVEFEETERPQMLPWLSLLLH